MNKVDYKILWRKNDAGGEEQDGALITVHTPGGTWEWRRQENEGNIAPLIDALARCQSPAECDVVLTAWIRA